MVETLDVLSQEEIDAVGKELFLAIARNKEVLGEENSLAEGPLNSSYICHCHNCDCYCYGCASCYQGSL